MISIANLIDGCDDTSRMVQIEDSATSASIIQEYGQGNAIEDCVVTSTSIATDEQGMVLQSFPPMTKEQTLKDYNTDSGLSKDELQLCIMLRDTLNDLAGNDSEDNDDDSDTTESEGEDDDDDEGEKKSRDGDNNPEDGNGDHDPMAGGSASAPVQQNMFIPFNEATFFPNDGDLETYMSDASIAGIEVVMGKIDLIGAAWCEAHAKLKERVIIMKREVANQRRAVAKAKTRLENKARKEADDRSPFTVMVQPIGIEGFTTTFAVSLPKKSNVKDLKISILRQMGISYKDASIKKFSFIRERLETEDFTAEEREKMVLTKENHKKDICGASKFIENEKVIMRVAGLGGAGKKRTKITDVVDEIEVLFAPEVSSNDVQVVKSALALKSISVKGWIESLNHDDAGALMKIMDKQTYSSGNLSATLNPFMPYIKEFRELDVSWFFLSIFFRIPECGQ